MLTGTVKWFNSAKGYGYIVPDEGGADVFVHHSVIELPGFRELTEGQRVEFAALDSSKGPQAVTVRPLQAQGSV